PFADEHAIARRKIARTVAEHHRRTNDAGAADELGHDELDPVRSAELEVGARPLRRDPRPRNDRVALGAQVLVEAAHVPAVVELPDGPLVSVARALRILVLGEVFLGPLAIDPADIALHLLGRIAPGNSAAHAETALEVRPGTLGAEKHHLAAE